MDKIELRKHSKYFFIASFIGIIILAVIIVMPFIAALLGSVLLTYIFYPVYKKFLRIFKNRHVASILLSFIILLILVIPLLFATNTVLNEANQFFHTISKLDVSSIDQQITKFLGENAYFASYIKDIVNKLSVSLLQGIGNFIFSLPQKILSLFVMFFVMYYLFKEGKGLTDIIKDELPLKERYKKRILNKFTNTVNAVIYGLLVTALIQGIIGTIGLFIFGVKSPILWGIVMTICAMLPIVGTALVWLPLAIYLLFVGQTFNGVGLFLYGLLIISTIDNIIKPKLIAGKGKLHPALVLLGVLGGLKIFGLTGIIIGPLVLSILVVFYELYKSEKHETEN